MDINLNLTVFVSLLLYFTKLLFNNAKDIQFTSSTTSNPCMAVSSSLATFYLSKISCSCLCMEDNICKGVLYNQTDGSCVVCTSYGLHGQPPYSPIPLFRTTKGGQCSNYLLDGIPDSQLSATSSLQHFFWHGPSRARLSSAEDRPVGLIGGWTARFNNINQHIQARFNATQEIMKIVTMGRNQTIMYVTSYKVSYSLDCSSFTFVKDNNDVIKVFPGNTDSISVVIQTLPQPVLALCVRVHPFTWMTQIAMRFDIIGCDW